MNEQNPRLTGTLAESITSLFNVVKAANNLVPGCAVACVLMTLAVIVVSVRSVPVIEAVVLFVVCLSALVVYTGTRNYGEAALALVAGILTAFAVDWTAGRFSAFLIVWVVFSLAALMIASIRLAANTESIYTEAAISLSNDAEEQKRLQKTLQAIGQKGTRYNQLPPMQRAEVIRLLVFRKVPIASLAELLQSVEIIAVVLSISHIDAAQFVVDVFKMLRVQEPGQYQVILDKVMGVIRGSAVPPSEFLTAFQQSRRLVLSGQMDADEYFSTLRDCLDKGIAPEDVAKMLIDEFGF